MHDFIRKVCMKVLCMPTFLTMLFVFSFAIAQQPAWRLANGTANNGIAAIDIYRHDPDTLYAIGIHGIIRSIDRGENWDSLHYFDADVGGIRVDPNNSQELYVSKRGIIIESNDIVMSTNGGTVWNLLFIGNSYPVPVVEIDPTNSATVYVGVGSFYLHRSTDRGQTWHLVTQALANRMTSLAIAPSNDSILYLGFNPGLFKSSDRGNTWTSLSLGFQLVSGVRIAVDPRNSDVVYVAVYTNGSLPGGIYKSTNGGSSWNEMNNGLDTQDRQINSLAISPKNPNELFLGIYSSQHVLFRTTDGGMSWSDFTNGLSGSGTVNSIAIDTLNDRVYVGVYLSPGPSGLYIYDQTTSANETTSELPARLLLEQNFPNPFNPTTRIHFSIGSSAFVSLKIHDILGREVGILTNQELRAGTYNVEFDAIGLASGVYFAVLSSEGSTIRRKMMFMK